MVGQDGLLAAIEAIYAAGLDEMLWPRALGAITRVVGGVGTALEVIERSSFVHREFQTYGLAPAGKLEYIQHYAALNPRFPAALREKPGGLSMDYLFIDEAAIDRSPFYAEFLLPQDLRYTIGGILDVPSRYLGVVAVQRSPRQGHAGRAEIAVMRQLAPHVSRALDVTWRLREANKTVRSFECALDFLADAALLIRADGSVAYANQAAEEMVRANDGVGIKHGVIELADPVARTKYHAAFASLHRLAGGDAAAPGAVDLHACRPSGAPAYLLAVRPLPANSRDRTESDALAIVFLHDPASRNAASARLLGEVFGLTKAEAGLAQALQAGLSLGDYAQARGLSLNTIYTHLRRIKEKTGSRRLPELIRKLNELGTPPLTT